MIIYSHNLAEKLFGFAYSKEFLRQNTDLCGFVDDPNLALDIDLAVTFHRALRSDPIAAEKVTNLLILSSAYIDPTTAEFYTDKMKQYPVFDYHIARINDIFNKIETGEPLDDAAKPDDQKERESIGRYVTQQLENIGPLSGLPPIQVGGIPSLSGIPYETPEKVIYESVSRTTGYTYDQVQDITFNSNFNSALTNALKDCLNSPCNLFSETSDSIASLANTYSMMNSNTMPTWGELKNNFFNALGGVPDTIFKKVPMSIKNTIIELGQIGQKAVEQSTEMFFAFKEEDKAKKQKIISKALAGQALDDESEGYKYLPDLDSYLNVSKMSSNILTKAAEDLGGCFNKFQQAYRYEPYNPEHNKSVTSKEPINNKVGDDQYKHNTLGKTNNDYDARTDKSMSSCDVQQPKAASGAGSTSGSKGKISESELRRNIKKALAGSSLIGYVPKDGAKYGITKGTAEEWEDFFVRLAKYESGFNTGARNDADEGGSLGLFQISVLDGKRYGANPTGADWTEAEAFDPYNNALTSIRIFERNVPKTGYIAPTGGKGAGGYFASTTMSKIRSDVSSGGSPGGGSSPAATPGANATGAAAKLQKGGNPSIYPFWNDLASRFSDITSLGIWGDASHQLRKSDHNTGDAIDVGIRSKSQGNAVYNDIISNANSNNVKYVIHDGKIWSPDRGERKYTGSNPHSGHVHVSFNK